MAVTQKSGGLLDVVAEAALIRKRCGFKRPPFSTDRLVKVVCPSALVTGADLPDGVDELVEIDERRRPTIFYSRGIPTGAQRMAIAHAVAHLIYDFRDGVGRRDALAEVRADLFALEVLAPTSLTTIGPRPNDPLRAREWDDDLDKIASRFHIPRTSLLWRHAHFRTKKRLVKLLLT